MTRIVTKIKNIKVAGTSFNNNQGKLWHLKKNMDNATFSLRRMPTESNPNNIYIVARIKDTNKPFYIGSIPGNIAFWLAPKMDAAKETNTEYYVKIHNFRTVCGDKYIGGRFDLIHEIKKAA